MQTLKNSIFLAFKNDYKILLLLSLPALALCAFGLYRVSYRPDDLWDNPQSG